MVMWWSPGVCGQSCDEITRQYCRLKRTATKILKIQQTKYTFKTRMSSESSLWITSILSQSSRKVSHQFWIQCNPILLRPLHSLQMGWFLSKPFLRRRGRRKKSLYSTSSPKGMWSQVQNKRDWKIQKCQIDYIVSDSSIMVMASEDGDNGVTMGMKNVQNLLCQGWIQAEGAEESLKVP